MSCTHQDQIWTESVLGEGAECDLEGREGRRRAKRARWGKEEKPRFILGHNLQGSSEMLSPFINSYCGKAVLTKHRPESGGEKRRAHTGTEMVDQAVVCLFVCFAPAAPVLFQHDTRKLWDVLVSLVLFLVKAPILEAAISKGKNSTST